MSSSTDELDVLVRRGARAVFAAQIASQAVSLAALGLLARMVPPEAFGVMGVALPLVMLPRIAATLGFSAAAIQDASGDEALISALFWRTALWSLAAAAVSMVLGVVGERLYAMDQLLLAVAALSVATALNALSVVPLALLERRMKLQAAAIVRLIAQSTAAVAAVALAWRGFDLVALLSQHVVEIALLGPLAWWLSGWRPQLRVALPDRTRRFSGYYALSSLLFYAAQNVDKLLLAAWLGSSPRGQALMGMYAQACNVMLRPVYFVTTPLSSVMLPALSRVQHDSAARGDLMQRFYSVNALLLLPAGLGLHLVSQEVMQVLTPRWPEAGDLLAALSLVVVAQGFINIAGSVLAAAQRSDLLCFAALVQLLLLAQGVWGGASFAASDYQFNATEFDPVIAQYRATLGAAYGVMLVTTIVLLLPYTAFVFRTAGVPMERFFRSLTVALPASLAMGVVVYFVRQGLMVFDVSALVRLAACVTVGVLSYALITAGTWRRVFGN